MECRVDLNKNRQWPQWLAALSASLGFFIAGICFSWTSPSLPKLQSDESSFTVSNAEAAWIASFLPIGSVVGAIVGCILSRILGPKYATIISAVPYFVGFVLIIIANGPIWLYVSRFLSGVAAGFSLTITPIYVAEISESRNRGALLSSFTFNLCVGALFELFVAPYLNIQLMAEIASIFSVLFFVLMLFMPDSPYYLARINKFDEAKRSLIWLRRQKDETVLCEELSVIEKTVCENASITTGLKELFKTPNLKGLGFVNLSFATQNVCGAIIVMFHQERISDIAQIPLPPEVSVMIISVIGNTAGLLSVLVVDRWGRKPLILISAMGCSLSTATLGIYLYLKNEGAFDDYPIANWTPFLAMITLQVCFAFGLSPVPCIQLGEFFTSNVKEIALCICSIFAALGGFIITKLFQVIEDSFGLAVDFWGLSFLTFTGFVLILWLVPETTGKNFLEIQSMLTRKEVPVEETNTRNESNNLERY